MCSTNATTRAVMNRAVRTTVPLRVTSRDLGHAATGRDLDAPARSGRLDLVRLHPRADIDRRSRPGLRATCADRRRDRCERSSVLDRSHRSDRPDRSRRTPSPRPGSRMKSRSRSSWIRLDRLARCAGPGSPPSAGAARTISSGPDPDVDRLPLTPCCPRVGAAARERSAARAASRGAGGEQDGGAARSLPDAPGRDVGPASPASCRRSRTAPSRRPPASCIVERDVAIGLSASRNSSCADHEVRELRRSARSRGRRRARAAAASRCRTLARPRRIARRRSGPHWLDMFGASFRCTMATSWLPTAADGGRRSATEQVAATPQRAEARCRPRSTRRSIEAPPEDVWGFMVDPAALSAWFGADAWLEPEPDGIVWFRFADGAERRGRVEHVAAFRTLTWRWREHLRRGFGSRIGEPSFVTIELRRVPTGTRVRITERPASALASEPMTRTRSRRRLRGAGRPHAPRPCSARSSASGPATLTELSSALPMYAPGRRQAPRAVAGRRARRGSG